MRAAARPSKKPAGQIAEEEYALLCVRLTFITAPGATLRDVVEHYDKFFKSGLTEAEKNDLIEYLLSL